MLLHQNYFRTRYSVLKILLQLRLICFSYLFPSRSHPAMSLPNEQTLSMEKARTSATFDSRKLTYFIYGGYETDITFNSSNLCC